MLDDSSTVKTNDILNKLEELNRAKEQVQDLEKEQ